MERVKDFNNNIRSFLFMQKDSLLKEEQENKSRYNNNLITL